MTRLEFDYTISDDDACVPSMPHQDEQSWEAGGAFVPPEISEEIFGLVYDNACVESLARHIPMKRETMVFRSISEGVEGYWVGSMCVKEKDSMTFSGDYMTAKKMAVIVPVEDELLEDADVDIVSMISNDVGKKFVLLSDRTFMGYEPTSPFADSLSGNVPAGHIVTLGDEAPDIAADISLAISMIEEDGFEPTGMIGHTALKHVLRNLRDLDNRPIFTENLGDCAPRERYCLWGYPICFSNQAALQSSPPGYELLIADFSQVIIGDRTGIQFAISKDATLTYGTSDTVNMFEQDMTAFRFVRRVAFLIANDNALAKVVGIVR